MAPSRKSVTTARFLLESLTELGMQVGREFAMHVHIACFWRSLQFHAVMPLSQFPRQDGLRTNGALSR
eukprot:4378155-Amphidinium_carterae.1